jgi:hypothetical protein
VCVSFLLQQAIIQDDSDEDEAIGGSAAMESSGQDDRVVADGGASYSDSDVPSPKTKKTPLKKKKVMF